jgi:DNA-binding response OmpR family regulator
MPYPTPNAGARGQAGIVGGGGAQYRPSLTFDSFRLDPASRVLTDQAGTRVDLTRKEFDLLEYLLRNPGRALSRQQILDAIWGAEVVVDERTVDNFVSSLKKKLGWSERSGFRIVTVRGVGYRMELAGA